MLETVSLLKDVVLKNLCTCVDFIVLSIQFNFYGHSDCAVATHDPRICNFHLVLLIERFSVLCSVFVHLMN
jgi:hypothetical protein